MIAKICLFFALFLLISSCQAASRNYNRDNSDEKNEEMLPWMLMMMQNGAGATATPGVCLVSMFSLGVVYLFSHYA